MQATITTYVHEKDSEAKENNNKTFVAYKIRCKLDGIDWELSKRYSEFHNLQKSLSKSASPTAQKSLAKFPPKLVFGNLNDAKILKRKFNLQVWLDSILTNDELYESQEVHSFLETKKHVPSFTMTTNVKSSSIHTSSSGSSSNSGSHGGTSKSSSTSNSVTSTSSHGSTSSNSSSQELVKALFTYKKNDDSEIGFEQGDVLLVLQKDESGWWYGRVHTRANGDKVVLQSQQSDMNELNGFFPSNYVTQIETSLIAPPKKTIKRKVKFDYQADPASFKTSHRELSIKAGEIVVIIESGPDNNGWCFVHKEGRSTEEGWIPEDYLDKAIC